MKITEENKNKACLTTKYVMHDNSPIISVYYDEDEDWQFLGKEDVAEEDAFVISVEQIIEHDPSLKNLPNLNVGQTAYRNNIDDQWEIVD